MYAPIPTRQEGGENATEGTNTRVLGDSINQPGCYVTNSTGQLLRITAHEIQAGKSLAVGI